MPLPLLASVSTAALGAALLLFILPWLHDNVVVVVRRLWMTRHVPSPPASLLLGHIPTLLETRYRSFRLFGRWSQELGGIFRVRFFGRPVLVVTDPDLYQPLLRSGPANLPKYTAPYAMFELFTRPRRANILTSPTNATWKAVRQAAVAALNMANMRLCFPQITAVTQRLIDTLSNSAAAGSSGVDMDAVAAAITVDVIGLAGFNRDMQATRALPASATSAAAGATPTSQHLQQGSSASEQPTSSAGICGSVLFPRGVEVLNVMHHLLAAMQSRNHPFNRWFPWRQAYKDLFTWGNRLSDLVLDLVASMEDTPPPPHTLGAHLLSVKYSSGVPLDRSQICAENGVFLTAGFETTAHTISWTLFLLATHPEAEARLCAELDSLGLLATPDRPTPAPLQWEHLGQLKYLAAVLNESMRMFPAVSSGTIRITDRPITLGGHRLPKGQPVLVPFWAVHRSPKLWGPDADSFKPERFLAAAAAGAPEAVPAAATAPAPAAAAPPAAAAAAGGKSRAARGGSTSKLEGADADDYVDVAADLAAERDQADKQQQATLRSSSSTRSGPALDLKDPTVDGRGFLPFSLGTRNCVGQALAVVELKAVLAMLVGAFSFSLHPSMGGYAGVDASAKQTITLKPEHGLLMTLKHRGAVNAASA